MGDAKLDGSKYNTLTFDCYGTLIDWENGILGHLQPLLHAYYVNTIDEFLLRLFSEVEPAAQTDGRSYREVLGEVMQQISKRLAFTPNNEILDGLANSMKNWQPFDDTKPVLEALKRKFKLGIISNVDNDLFAHSQALMGVQFDHVTTAQDVGVYKPNTKMFEHALAEIEGPVLHVAQSRFHDIAPASKLGIDTVWINRSSKGAAKPDESQPHWTFTSLADFANALGVD